MKTARTLISISFLLAAATLFAQTENRQLMRVNVPFSFGVEDHYLPAAEYTIFTVTPQRAIRLVSSDGRHSAIINTLPTYGSTPSTRSSLTFHRYGTEYFLGEVRTTGQNVSRKPLSGKKAMQLASSGEKPETLAVFALAEPR